jgi:predicted nucleic acid-binding protein
VISEVPKKVRDANVMAWLSSANSEALFISAISVFETERGIARLRRKDPEFADRLDDWFATLVAGYGERILRLTRSSARLWGQLAARLGHSELDLAIAATALEHGLTVVTRNVSNFVPTGVATFNPFSA